MKLKGTEGSNWIAVITRDQITKGYILNNNTIRIELQNYLRACFEK